MSKAKFDAARELIRDKQYDAARTVLKTIDDPLATEWLKKLDRLVPEIASSASATQLLQNAVVIFTKNDWNLKIQTQDMAQLEKKKGPGNLASAIVILTFSIIGMLIVIAGIATSKLEKVTLQVNTTGRLRVISGNRDFAVAEPEELMTLAQSIRPGATYAGAILFGILSFFIWAFILSSFR